MRGFLLPVLFLVPAAVGIWFYLNPKTYVTRPADASTSASQPTTEKKADPKAKKSAPQSAQTLAPAAISAPVEPPAAAAPEPVAAPETVKTQAAPALPPEVWKQEVNQVNPGMQSTAVLELLGKPTLHTMTNDRGSLKETYVYSSNSDAPFEIIHVTDGKVTSRSR